MTRLALLHALVACVVLAACVEVERGDSAESRPIHATRRVDGMIGSELPLDDVGSAPAPWKQYRPSIAFGGSQYLVTWSDSRNTKSTVYAARISSNGVVLDPVGIPISSSSGNAHAPRVAAGGGIFMVTWTEDVGATSEIRAARVNATGAVLDPGGFVVSAQTGSNGATSSVAWGSGAFLVVFEEQQDIHARRYDTNGAPLGSTLTVCNAGNTQKTPTVASDGTAFFVAWHDARNSADYDLYGVHISGSGVVQTPNGGFLAEWGRDDYDPEVSFGGGSFWIAWWHERIQGGDQDVAAMRIDASGVPDLFLPVADSTASDDLFGAVGFSGDQLLVAWQGKARRFDLDGGALDGAPLSLLPNGSKCAVGSDGVNFLVACDQGLAGTGDVSAVLIAPAGNVLGTPLRVNRPGRNQVQVAIAGAPDMALTVWTDTRAGQSDVYGARVSSQGEVLDVPAFPIAKAPFDQTQPTVVFDGIQFLVAWSDARDVSTAPDIYVARVALDGGVLDPGGVRVADQPGAQTSPALASTGNGGAVLLWRDDRPLDPGLYGSRLVSGIAQELNGVKLLAGTSFGELELSAGPNGDYLVAWATVETQPQIRATRLTSQLQVLDPVPLAFTDAGMNTAPSAAFAGQDYTLAWEELFADGGSVVRFARASVDGNVGAFGDLSISDPAPTRAPELHAVGPTLWLAYERSDSSGRSDILAGPVGAAFEVDAGTLSAAAEDERWPALALTSSNLVVSYSRIDPASGAVRAFARTVDATTGPDAGSGPLDGGNIVPGGPDGGDAGGDAGEVLGPPRKLQVGIGCQQGGAAPALLALCAGLCAAAARRRQR